MIRSKNRMQGVAAIEFALGFIFFWLMCATIIDISYFGYRMGQIDYNLSQLSRFVKLTGIESKNTSDFIDDFNTDGTPKKDKNGKKIMNRHYAEAITTEKNLQKLGAEVKFDCFSSIKELASNPIGKKKKSLPSNPKDNSNCPIVRLYIDYQFKPLFMFFYPKDHEITRQTIVFNEIFGK